MTDEEWLELVGEAARERRREDAALLASMEATEEGRELLAALDEGARARIAAASFRSSQRARRAKVISIGVSTALAAAAAVLMTVRGVSPAAPLPGYEVAIAGPPSPLRGAPATSHTRSIVLTPASPLEIVLRPDEDVRGPVAAGAFLVDGAGARPWDAPVEISADGAVRIAGEADRLFSGRRGDFDVVVLVARPGALPDAAYAIDATTSRDGNVRAVRLNVTITP